MSETLNLHRTVLHSVLPDGRQVVVEHHNIKKSILTLKALHHKLRLQIVKLLDENQQMTVTDIFVKLRIEQSVASQQLAILRRARVVVTERQGKFIFYKLNLERIAELNKIAEELSN
jgi:ArsR family transcriptional regulator, virulence genes transcriptional regulator